MVTSVRVRSGCFLLVLFPLHWSLASGSALNVERQAVPSLNHHGQFA